MAEERNALNGDHPAAAWFRRDLEAVQADLLVVLQKHWPRVGTQLIAHALIETTGSVLAAITTDEPATAPAIDVKLGELRLFAATTNVAPQ